MDLIAKIFTVSGLCLDIVGASFLAYEFLTYAENPSHRPENYKKAQLDNVRQMRDWFIATYKNIQPPLSGENLQKRLAEINEEYGEMESSIETELAELPEMKRSETVRWAKLGLKLLIAGFAMQAIGAILS